jgi:signal transduction histidine kinase
VTVAGDAEALREIVDNLLGNAIKYTPPGGKIDVSLSQVDRHAVLEVKDTGLGIEPRDQGRIFERFYRADKHRSTEAGGTGLGLSIVKNIAIAHGGDVSLSSVPGKGSAFSVRIPLVPKSV